MTPYAEALHWIERHPDTGSGVGLAKLILSLWNTDCGFGFRECVGALDDDRSALALRVVQHFTMVGEDAELIEVGHAVCKALPRLWEASRAMQQARSELRDRWYREEREAEEARERQEG